MISFALSASVRSLYQLATKASEAPVAYALSALAGAVYVAQDRDPSSEEKPAAARPAAKQYLAVLSFKDLSGDPNGQLVSTARSLGVSFGDGR